jgi:hypothetical protein
LGKRGKTTLVHESLILLCAFWNRTICRTATGRLGTAALDAKAGDIVVVVPGCSCLLLFRKIDSCYTHIGPCYVDGIDQDEIERVVEAGEAEFHDFELC